MCRRTFSGTTDRTAPEPGTGGDQRNISSSIFGTILRAGGIPFEPNCCQ